MSTIEESKELRITKKIGTDSIDKEDSEYGDIYRVKFPVTFYFNKDGTYDGLGFDTEDITEEEVDLLEELLDKLAESDDYEDDEEDSNDE